MRMVEVQWPICASATETAPPATPCGRVVLGDPEALVARRFGRRGELSGLGQRLVHAAAFAHRHQVEDRKRDHCAGRPFARDRPWRSPPRARPAPARRPIASSCARPRSSPASSAITPASRPIAGSVASSAAGGHRSALGPRSRSPIRRDSVAESEPRVRVLRRVRARLGRAPWRPRHCGRAATSARALSAPIEPARALSPASAASATALSRSVSAVG